MTAASDLAWPARWKAIRPNAQYNAAFGIEGAWRQNADEWGYPLEDAESDVDYNGQTAKGRTFSRAGLIVWDPSAGAVVLGWPG